MGRGSNQLLTDCTQNIEYQKLAIDVVATTLNNGEEDGDDNDDKIYNGCTNDTDSIQLQVEDYFETSKQIIIVCQCSTRTSRHTRSSSDCFYLVLNQSDVENVWTAFDYRCDTCSCGCVSGKKYTISKLLELGILNWQYVQAAFSFNAPSLCVPSDYHSSMISTLRQRMRKRVIKKIEASLA
jgi:hypothetical protein